MDKSQRRFGDVQPLAQIHARQYLGLRHPIPQQLVRVRVAVPVVTLARPRQRSYAKPYLAVMRRRQIRRQVSRLALRQGRVFQYRQSTAELVTEVAAVAAESPVAGALGHYLTFIWRFLAIPQLLSQHLLKRAVGLPRVVVQRGQRHGFTGRQSRICARPAR